MTISVDIQILYGCSLQFPSGVPGFDKMVIEFKYWKRTNHYKVISRQHTEIGNEESKSVINNRPFSIIGYEMGDFTWMYLVVLDRQLARHLLIPFL